MPPGSPATAAVRRLRAAAVGSLCVRSPLGERSPLGVRSPLGEAVRSLGFVQYDPIRRPARAQDLIMRHRVPGYRQGDLERCYDGTGVEEDYLHVYGAVPAPVAALLHPRRHRHHPGGVYRPDELATDVLALVRADGPIGPREVSARLGATRAVNGWGGFSAATTNALEALHRYGLIRVTGRSAGTKIYGPVARPEQTLPPGERLRRLALHLAGVLAPVSERVLRTNVSLMTRGATGRDAGRAPVAELLRSGELASEIVDGVRYLWPAHRTPAGPDDVPAGVRLLAPFDPVVWDRARFEHLWGWPYRFEAYTPPARRVLGYYALPMLLGDRVIGWANAEVDGGLLSVRYGFAGRRHTGRTFRWALDAEVAALAATLAVDVGTVAEQDAPDVGTVAEQDATPGRAGT